MSKSEREVIKNTLSLFAGRCGHRWVGASDGYYGCPLCGDADGNHHLIAFGLNRRAARKFAARELEHAGVFTAAPSPRAIQHWQTEQPPPLNPADEQLLGTAIAVCGVHQPHRLARYFIGLAHLVHNPTAKVVHEIAP
jgi:hypothetical protein